MSEVTQFRELCLRVVEQLTELHSAIKNGGDPQRYRDEMADALHSLAGDVSELFDLRLAISAAADEFTQSPGSLCNWTIGARPLQPLQVEFCETDIAGELFFSNLEKYLVCSESESARNVLEVYAYCLALGYQGKYAGHNLEGLEVLSEKVYAAIRPVCLYPELPQRTWQTSHSKGFPWLMAAGVCVLFVGSLWLALYILVEGNTASYVEQVEFLVSQHGGSR